MRKAMVIMSVLVIVIFAGTAYIVLELAGTAEPRKSRINLSLSFKPYTFEQLLTYDLEVDPKTCGKRIQSAQFKEIEQRTSEIRGLPLKKEVPLYEATEETIKMLMLLEFQKETNHQENVADEKVLKGLGLIPQDDDLEEILAAVFTEQIAGFYDTETKQITVAAGAGAWSADDEITLSHEVTHALQDQNFDLEAPPLEDDAYTDDEDVGIESLVEGDATNTMFKYAREYISMEEMLKIQREAENIPSEEFDKAPLYIRERLMFPYEQGLEFTTAVLKGGAEDKLDPLFADPPLSSKQVIHPELFMEGRGGPRDVPMPDLKAALGEGWKRINNDALGEFDIEVWFDEFTDGTLASEVSEGWGGNTIQYYQGEGRSYAMPNMTAWDTDLDAQEFFEGYVELLKGRFKGAQKKVGGDGDWYIYEAGGVVFYCGIAGDTTLALQATSRAQLDTAIKQFPQMPQP